MREMFSREERGQSLIEFAFGALVLIVLLAGIVDLGRGLYSYVVIANAARMGARYGASYPQFGADAIRTKAISEAGEAGVVLAADDITVSPVPPAGSGLPLQVDVHYEFEPLLGGILGIFGAPLDIVGLNASAQMLVM